VEHTLAEIVQTELAEEISTRFNDALVDIYAPFQRTDNGSRSGPNRKLIITSKTDPLLLVQIRFNEDGVRIWSQLGTLNQADAGYQYCDPSSIQGVLQILESAFGGG
jgi:hypothetical protein